MASDTVIPSCWSGSDVKEVLKRSGAVAFVSTTGLPSMKLGRGAGPQESGSDNGQLQNVSGYLWKGELRVRVAREMLRHVGTLLHRSGELWSNEVCVEGVDVAFLPENIARAFGDCGL